MIGQFDGDVIQRHQWYPIQRFFFSKMKCLSVTKLPGIGVVFHTVVQYKRELDRFSGLTENEFTELGTVLLPPCFHMGPDYTLSPSSMSRTNNPVVVEGVPFPCVTVVGTLPADCPILNVHPQL